MKRWNTLLYAALFAGLTTQGAWAAQDDIDVTRLNNSLNQLANDPSLGDYAQAEQAQAHNAVDRLAQARSKEQPHALYLAERSVDRARAAAQLQDTNKKINQLDREHDQIMLEASQRDAKAARMELERQRLQYQMAQEETQRLQQQGMEYSQAAEQAQAEAAKANKLAAAQSRVASAAKREAAAAAAAARAMRSQMDSDDAPADAGKSSSSKSGKTSSKKSGKKSTGKSGQTLSSGTP